MSEIIHLNKEQTKGIAFVDKFGGRQMRIKADTYHPNGCKDCIFSFSKKDTLLDLACYSVMALVWLEQKGAEK